MPAAPVRTSDAEGVKLLQQYFEHQFDVGLERWEPHALARTARLVCGLTRGHRMERPTQESSATRLLRVREELAQAEAAADESTKALNLRKVQAQQRRETLRGKHDELTRTLLRFDRFLAENDKRCKRAVQKARRTPPRPAAAAAHACMRRRRSRAGRRSASPWRRRSCGR